MSRVSSCAEDRAGVANAPSDSAAGLRKVAAGERSVKGARRSTHVVCVRGLRELEVGALLERMVVALEARDCSEVACEAAGIPRLLVGDRFIGAEQRVADCLCEHASFAPAPHFVAGGIENGDVVSFAAGEIDFDGVIGDVGDAQADAHGWADGDLGGGGQCGGGRHFFFCDGVRSVLVRRAGGGFVVSGVRAPRHEHGAGTE